MQQRKTLVLFSLGTALVLGANTVVVKKQVPKPRKVMAFAVIYILLGFLVEFAPDLAVMFAALVFVSVALSQGSAALGGVRKAIR